MKTTPFPAVRVPGFLLLVLIHLALSTQSANSQGYVGWKAGVSYFHYLPGAQLQGAYDLARCGPVITVPDAEFGLYLHEIVSPGEIVERGSLPGRPIALAGNDSYVYVADLSAPHFRVVDITDLERPRLVGSLSDGLRGDLEYDSGFVYAAGGGLEVIDVSDPATPTLVGSLMDTDWQHVAARGDLVFASWRGGLWSIDVSDPTAPRRGSLIQGGDRMEEIVIDGEYLFATERGFGLHIFRLSEFGTPTRVAGVPFLGARSLAVGDGWVVLGADQSMRVVDVTDPHAPIAQGTLRGITPTAGFVEDGFAYLSAETDGVQVIEIQSGDGPTPLASFPAWAVGRELSHVGEDRLALITDSGLEILNVSDSDAPISIGSLPLDRATALSIDEDLAYVVADRTLKIVSLLDETFLAVVGLFEDVRASKIIVTAGRAYLQDYGLSIVDVSDPSSPVLLGVDFFGDRPRAMTASGMDVYMGIESESFASLWWFSYEDPNDRTTLGAVEVGYGSIEEVEAIDGTLYVGGALEILTVDPSTFTISARLGDHEFASARIARGANGVIYGLNKAGGFHAFDSELGYSWTGASPAEVSPGNGLAENGLAEVGDRLYITDSAGLHIYECPAVASSVPTRNMTGKGDALHVFPNPSRGPVRLSWERSPGSRVTGEPLRLEFYSVGGQLLRSIEGGGSTGDHWIWDGRDADGHLLPAGTVFTRVISENGYATGSIRVLR